MSEWQHIFDGAPLRALEQGAVLFRREDRVRSMYLVRSGMVALERPMNDGTSLTLHIATAGRCVGRSLPVRHELPLRCGCAHTFPNCDHAPCRFFGCTAR
ncbi:cyclic nucleotide-binding domain-containing protein [Sagittula sp. MA-2]|uniref:cyclic nucleotide-binding domain-containing protein n=1 Tax=Sagittula sp. MA-2 TaxID=3048007 RepID=UPI00358FCEF1